MIIDSHCHAWTRWPYQPAVPDDEQRGRIEQLLHEMDVHGVDRALVVCAEIDRNPDNNAYIAEQIGRYGGRLYQVADVDCLWSPTYHTPGAARRLEQAADSFPIRGFTHYLRDDDDGAWLYSAEGRDFFGVAAERGLLASIACHPGQQAALRRVAELYPTLPILCHHLSGLRVEGGRQALSQVLPSAQLPNIFIKLSGFAYCAPVGWAFPYHETHEIIRALYEHFGTRMCWGSDYPVVRFYMTYQHSLEAFRTHCDFVAAADREAILGGTLLGLFEPGTPG